MADVIGLGVVVQELQTRFHTREMTIGGASIDPAGPTLLFPGINWTWQLVLERSSTLAVPLAVIGLATAWFHRFDPARVKYSTWSRRRNPIARLNAMLKPIARVNVISKPLTRLFGQISDPGKAMPTMVNAIRADIAATFALSPLTGIAIVASGILCLVEGAEVVQHVILPAIFGVLVAALADIAVRDSAAGMASLLFTAPKLKANYVVWKFFSVLAVTLMFTFIPAIRLLGMSPAAAISLLIGSCFAASAAVAFGILTRSPKLYVGFLLMLIYISLNLDKVSLLDFAGFHSVATHGIQFGYAGLSMVLLICAEIRHRSLLRKA
ncbi:MAG: hypothetical protein E6K56_00130 [Ignavibacteria bacterium]|nr:MAG: hypothetical protein E6K56_00130 [Ignavibacteria bacterium]